MSEKEPPFSEDKVPDKSLASLEERERRAKQEARPLAEAEEEAKISARLVNDFLRGRITLQEFNEKGLQKTGELQPGELELSDLEEMLAYLEKSLKDSNLAKELTEHERRHYDVIAEVGWPARLLFRFFRDEKGKLFGRPGVEPNIPEEGDVDDIRKKLRQIIEAVDDPSDHDHLATKGEE